jgi:hypothetical protein
MSSPNLITANVILGKTTGLILANTTTQIVLNNPSGSGKTFKVNTLNLANYGNTVANSTVSFYTQASLAGTALFITANTTIPAGVTLNLIDKSSQYYLEENTSLGISAATGNVITVTCSYEDIS